MGGKFNKLRKRAADVINNIDKTNICYMQLENGFSDMKSIISKHGKR